MREKGGREREGREKRDDERRRKTRRKPQLSSAGEVRGTTADEE
jgi:hypothetical protein